ncbi:MAG: serine/threonine protein kinase with repeat, partial [Myxococcales bacterium]|nr:serine/threonine protein kinase with repeat [Myxococcales bacterium]
MRASRFGRFEILQRLGAGAVGEVLLVTDGRREFALKRLLPHLCDDASAATFDNEAALSERLRHRNIVAVLEHGRIDEVPYLLMERIDGTSLHRLLATDRRLPPSLAAFVVGEVCRALAYAHAVAGDDGRPLGLIHRDVSPANVLVGRDGSVKLCDFGIAKTSALGGAVKTRSGVVKGKLGYLSPEQAAGEPLDARTDLFSAGAVLYEALTGVCPFAPDEEGTVVARPGAGGVERPSRRAPELPAALDRVCARALAPSREERFGSAAEMAAALDVVVGSSDAQAELAAYMSHAFAARQPRTNEPTQTVAAGRRRRWTTASVAVVAVAVGAWSLARWSGER